MRRGALLAAAVAVAGISLAGIEAVHGVMSARRVGSSDSTSAVQPMRYGHVLTFWSGGRVKSDVTYQADAYDGEYRTWYESGAPYELRHYVGGHEEGVQQSWTDSGVAYLNYEVRDGRRFGLVNASPCNTVVENGEPTVTGPAKKGQLTSGSSDGQSGWRDDRSANRLDESGLPYYDEPTFSPRWAPVPHRVASFSLLTQTGSPLSNVALHGHPYVASFIYTQCAAICPLVVGQLSRVQNVIAHGGARIVSFSVTPDTDTPAALATFGRERSIDPRIWSLVTGSKRTIYTLARTSYFADDSRVGVSPDDETAFLHTEKLLLVDGDGYLRGVYNGTQPHAVDQLIDDLARLTQGH